MAIKQQEFRFVEWSRGVSQGTYDVAHVIECLRSSGLPAPRVADVGGGIGSVAFAIVGAIEHATVDVFDNSELAKSGFVDHERVRLLFGDFCQAEVTEQYDAVIFRTVLHHFVCATELETTLLQSSALAKAASMLSGGGTIYITENFYESKFSADLCATLIYRLTRLKYAASLFRALGANTAGEGVRFRSLQSWSALFAANNLKICGDALKQQWAMPAWQRVPLLCSERFQGLVKLQRTQD